MIVYDSGPVPLLVRLVVLPFLVLGGMVLPQILAEHNGWALIALAPLLYLFIGVWRFRSRLLLTGDGEVHHVHQGIVSRWTRRIRREALGGVRVSTRRMTFGTVLTEVEVFTRDGRPWFGTPPHPPDEARRLAAQIAQDLGL